jgi:hypothetical protein
VWGWCDGDVSPPVRSAANSHRLKKLLPLWVFLTGFEAERHLCGIDSVVSGVVQGRVPLKCSEVAPDLETYASARINRNGKETAESAILGMEAAKKMPKKETQHLFRQILHGSLDCVGKDILQLTLEVITSSSSFLSRQPQINP